MILIWLIGIIFLILISISIFVGYIWKIEKYPHKRTPDALDLEFEEVSIPTKNNKNLYGWWIPGKESTNKVVILQHGWGRNLERMLRYINILKSESFHMLTFDFRGHGSSDREKFPNMYLFSQDIISALDYVENRLDNNKPIDITVLGHSVGGAATVSAAGRDSRIDRVVTLGAPAHPYDIMRYEFDKHNFPNFVSNTLLKFIEFRIKKSFNSFAPSCVIKMSSAKMLIIHGTEDKVVPVEQANKMVKNADKDKVKLLIMNGIKHSNFEDFPGFNQKLINFINGQSD